MEQKLPLSSKINKEDPISPSRRDFLKKIGYLGTAVFASPLINATEKIPADFSNGQENNKKHKQFIVDQINKIKEIIEAKKYGDILSNPYLASCLYYSQSFIDKISNAREDNFISERIIKSAAYLITPEFRKGAILELEKQTKDKEFLEDKKISVNEISPLESFSFGKGKNHEDALDLFTEESSPIYSMESGLVIVADKGWDSNDETSSSSMSGGNTVIVFNYLTKEFFRYAHLDKVAVSPGELIMESGNLGTVGHTGKNASLQGHGSHLHFEINKYLSDKNINRSLSVKEIKKRLKNLKHIQAQK